MRKRRAKTGQRNERVTIQRPVRERDELGGHGPDDWQDIGTFWAKVSARSGNVSSAGGEKELRGAEQELVSHRIIILFRDDIDASCRVLWRGKELAVTSVFDFSGRREELTIDVTEGKVP
ncbi:MAG: hypothetical protein Alpg2KO_00500 [Alphaproteobacteria bacterium]